MVGLLVLCLLLALGAAGSWAWAQRQDDSAVGGAISSQARENGVQQAATLTQQVLSYDWTSLDKDVKASEAVLARASASSTPRRWRVSAPRPSRTRSS